MGSSSSKPVSAAAGAARRQYPKTPQMVPPRPQRPIQQGQQGQQEQLDPRRQQQQDELQSSNAHVRDRAKVQAASQAPSTTRPPDSVRDQDHDPAAGFTAPLDPGFAEALRKIGPVTPFPTLSRSSAYPTPYASPSPFHGPSASPPPSGTQPASRPNTADVPFDRSTNPTLLALSTRAALERTAEEEMAEIGQPHGRRGLVDAVMIQRALAMRDVYRLEAEEIETALRLKKGVVEAFGRKGVVGNV